MLKASKHETHPKIRTLSVLTDDEVDRAQVEAQWWVKPSATNNTFFLLSRILYARFLKRRFGGGYTEVAPPDPISNSAVKYLKADDSTSFDGVLK